MIDQVKSTPSYVSNANNFCGDCHTTSYVVAVYYLLLFRILAFLLLIWNLKFRELIIPQILPILSR